jgi:nitrite reductase/ring-hydroxylating ferredoxin subunit
VFSIGSLFKAVMGICETQPLDPGLWQVEGGKLRVKISQLPELCQRGSAIYMKGLGLKQPVLLLRTQDDQYHAFENRSHRGKKLDPGVKEGTLRCCGVGHTDYDLEGQPISEPGKKPLAKYPVEWVGGDLLITIKPFG